MAASTRLIITVCLCLVSGAGAAADLPPSAAMAGTWLLDERASDSVEKRFSHFRKSPRGGFRDGGIGAGTGGAMGAQHGSGDGERDRTPRGSVRALVAARRIEINGSAPLSIIYDGEITRTLSPNPNGRVYSASGEELVIDRFGYTLAFWEGEELVVETTTRRGLDVVERYRIEAQTDRLTAMVTVTPSGEFGVELLRVYDRAAP